MKQIFVSLLCGLALIVAACGSDSNEQTVSIPNGVWNSFDTLDFQLPIHHAQNNVDIVINLMYDNRIMLRTLPVDICLLYPNGELRQDRKLVEFYNQNGDPRGVKTDGYTQLYSELYQNYSFPENGTYTLRLIQATNIFDLQGITTVSVGVQPTKHLSK